MTKWIEDGTKFVINEKAKFAFDLSREEKRTKLIAESSGELSSHILAVNENGWKHIVGADKYSPFGNEDYAVFTALGNNITTQLAVDFYSDKSFVAGCTASKEWYEWEEYLIGQNLPKGSSQIVPTHESPKPLADYSSDGEDAQQTSLAVAGTPINNGISSRKSKIKLDSANTVEAGEGIEITKIGDSIFISKEKEHYKATGTGHIGTPHIITVSKAGKYRLRAKGASGGYGAHAQFLGYKPGNGATIEADFEFVAGDELTVVVGQKGGDSIYANDSGTADGGTGGGGGATFVFKKIDAITDSRYQFEKAGQSYEVLLVAAGGSGTPDCRSSSGYMNGPNGLASTFYSPENYIAYSTGVDSTTTCNSVTHWIQKDLIATKGGYSSDANIYGGYGGGSKAGDDKGYFGGGWCSSSLSTSYYITTENAMTSATATSYYMGQSWSWSSGVNSLGLNGVTEKEISNGDFYITAAEKPSNLGGAEPNDIVLGKVFTDSGASTRTVNIPDITNYDQLTNKIFGIHANLSGSSGTATLNVNGLGEKSLYLLKSNTMSPSSTCWQYWINNGGVYLVTYDGTKFVVLNPLPPGASTTTTGLVQLNNTTNSSSTTEAATANAVKLAYEKAVEAYNLIISGESTGNIDIVTGKIFTDSGTTNRAVSISGVTSYDMLLNNIFGIKATKSGYSGTNTLNVNNLGAKNLKFVMTGISMTSIAWNSWVNINGIYMVVYNGTEFIVLNPLAPEASTSVLGLVQLNDSTTSTSSTQAATANAVKAAFDKAKLAYNVVSAEIFGGVVYEEDSSSTNQYRYINIDYLNSYDDLTDKVIAVKTIVTENNGGSSYYLNVNGWRDVEIVLWENDNYVPLPENWTYCGGIYKVCYQDGYFILINDYKKSYPLASFNCSISETIGLSLDTSYLAESSVLEIIGKININNFYCPFNMKFHYLDSDTQYATTPIMYSGNQVYFLNAEIRNDLIIFNIYDCYGSGYGGSETLTGIVYLTNL